MCGTLALSAVRIWVKKPTYYQHSLIDKLATKEFSLKNTKEISGQCKLLTKTAQLFKVLLPGCANVADDIHYLPREVLMC